jgi:carboxyl-terminal processing protease
MRSRFSRIRRVAFAGLLAAAVLIAPAASPARAQTDDVAAVFRDAHAFIVEYALRPVDPAILLQRALAAVDALAPPAGPAPALTGDLAADLEASAMFIGSALQPLPVAQREEGLAAALRAMIQELGDPFAAVFTPSEFRRFLEALRGERGGIGAQVDVGPAGGIVVSDVTAGGPAFREGVLPGDFVEEIDGRSTLLLTPDEVLRLLHAPAGTAASVTLRRGAVVRRVALIRAIVRENATRARVVEPRIGYLRLLEFSRQSSRDLTRAVAALQERGVQALIFDLRANSGGLVDEAVDVASVFLSDGAVAFEERRAGTEMLPIRTAARFTGPVVVLTDHGSASASEIVAGALQDTGIPIVGMPTYGKTTVQGVTVPPLAGEWGLRVTTARYLTRAQRNIEGIGLMPDVRIAMNPRLIQDPRDTQYVEALMRARRRLTTRAHP